MKLVARHDGQTIPLEVERQGSGYLVRIGDRATSVEMVNAGPYVYSLRFEDGTQFSLTHHRTNHQHEITFLASKAVVEVIDPLTLRRRDHADEGAGGGVVKALMPGRIVRVLAAEGDSVVRGAGILVLEAMKMENEIQAPADGKVERLFVKAGDTVEGGAPLVQLSRDT